MKIFDSQSPYQGVTFIQTGQDSTYYSFFSRVRVEHLARPEHDVIIVPSRIGMPEGGERTFVNDSLDIIKAVFGRSQASMQQRRVYNSISSGSAIAARTMVGMHIAGVTDIAHTFHMDGPISNLPETLQYYTARAGKIVHIILKLGVLRSVAAAKKAGINVDQQRNTFTALHALIKTRNDGNAAPMQFVVTGGIHVSLSYDLVGAVASRPRMSSVHAIIDTLYRIAVQTQETSRQLHVYSVIRIETR